MRVLHVISSGGMYGAEAVILALCEEFARQGHECAIATFDNKHSPNQQLAEIATSRGIRVLSVPCTGQLDRSALTGLRRLLREGKFDVCHSHGFKSDVYLYLAARSFPQRLVATCHTWYDNDWKVTLYGKLDRWILRKFDQVVSVSADVTHKLTSAGVRDEHVSFIRNGVDVSRFRNRNRTLRDELGITSEHLVLGTVGRLSPEKGVEYLLRAVPSLLETQPNLRVVLVGDGPEKDALVRLAAELRIDNAVRFLGRRTDTPEIFASLDILVQPSLNEGLPITLLEALASGCAIVATAVGTVPDVIDDGINGLLVPPGDSERLAAAISTLSDVELRGRLASGAREHAYEFSSEKMAEAYMRVYQQALGQTERATRMGA